MPTKTRPCAGKRRVGVPGWAFIRTVNTGSTFPPFTRVTRLGACGRAHARPDWLTTVSVPRSDCVAPWRLPVSRSCAGLQRASAEDAEAPLAAATPSAQQAPTRASRLMPTLKHRLPKAWLSPVAQLELAAGDDLRAATDLDALDLFRRAFGLRVERR